MSAPILIRENKNKIRINPFKLSGNLYPLVYNQQGSYIEDRNSEPEKITYNNDVRIGFQIKKIKKIENGNVLFYEQKVYFMLSDNETVVAKGLEFEYRNIKLKVIQRKELIKFNTIIGYEYELKDITEGNYLYG